MSWFEEWFDSPLYEKLYAYRNEEEAALLADLICRTIPAGDYPDVLDLGCGRGRHSLTLAERGYNVTGIDLSEQAIAKAKRLARNRNLNNVTFHVQDMRHPLDHTFDGVLNLFTTFGYFLDDEENSTVFRGVNSMLRSGGIFFMDFLNAEMVRKSLQPEDSGEYGQFTYRIRREIRDDMVFKTIRFTGGELDEPVEYTERVKLYDLDWFRSRLEENHFELLKTYGNYHGASYDPQSSPRLMMVSRKKG